MPQSNVLFGFLFAAFVIFVTSRGELPKYAAIFFGSASGGGSGGGGGATNAPATDAAPADPLKVAAGRLDTIFKSATGGKLGLFGGPITDLGNKLLDTIDGK